MGLLSDLDPLTIIGAGPAGLTTAIYTARDGYNVMVIDEGALGGQASTTENVRSRRCIASTPGCIFTQTGPPVDWPRFLFVSHHCQW
jgi:thioredoxin reductase